MRRVIVLVSLFMCLFTGVAFADTITYTDSDGKTHTVEGTVTGSSHGDNGYTFNIKTNDGKIITVTDSPSEPNVTQSMGDILKDRAKFEFLNKLDEKFNEASSNGISALRGPVYATAMILGVISLASNWTLYEGQLRLSFIIETIMKTAFFLWIISLWGSITAAIGNTFLQAGALAATGDTGDAVGQGTGDIVSLGFACVQYVWQDITFVNAIAHPIDSIMRVIGIFCILAGYLLLAFEMLVTKIEWNVFRCLSMMFIPFGILRMTSSFFSGVIRGLFSYGAKLMVVTFLGGLIFKFTEVTSSELTKESTTADTVVMGFVFLVLAWIVRSAGALASSLVSGTPSLSGAGLKAALTAPVAAAGGAVVGAAAVAATGGTAAVAQAAAGGASSAAGTASASGFSMSQFTTAMTNGVFGNDIGGSLGGGGGSNDSGQQSLFGGSSDSGGGNGGASALTAEMPATSPSGGGAVNRALPLQPAAVPAQTKGAGDNIAQAMNYQANGATVDYGKVNANAGSSGNVGGAGGFGTTATPQTNVDKAINSTIDRNGNLTGNEKSYDSALASIANEPGAAESLVNGTNNTSAGGEISSDGTTEQLGLFGQDAGTEGSADNLDDVKDATSTTASADITAGEAGENGSAGQGGNAGEAGQNAQDGTATKVGDATSAGQTGSQVTGQTQAQDGADGKAGAKGANVAAIPMSAQTMQAKEQMEKANKDMSEAAGKVFTQNESGQYVPNPNASKEDKEKFFMAASNYQQAKENFNQHRAIDTANHLATQGDTNVGVAGATGAGMAAGMVGGMPSAGGVSSVGGQPTNVTAQGTDARGGMSGTGTNVNTAELSKEQKENLSKAGISDETIASMRKMQQEEPEKFAYLSAAHKVLDEKGNLKEDASSKDIDTYINAKNKFDASEQRKAKLQDMLKQESTGVNKTFEQQTFGRRAMGFTGRFVKELAIQSIALAPGVDPILDGCQRAIARSNRLKDFASGNWSKHDSIGGQYGIYVDR